MKFIHISDLHFNPKNDGRTSRNIRESLIPYLKNLNLSVDELLITGDYRHAGYQGKDPAEITDVVKYIKEIADAVGITDVTHIHLVPGNHDRDREDENLEGARTPSIRAYYDSNIGNFKEDDLAFLEGKFDYFIMVCNTLYGPNHFWTNSLLHTYREINGTVFLYMNTAIMHNCNQDRLEHRLIIGNDRLDQLLNEIAEHYPNEPIVVLAHHSPDWFTKHEKEAVEEIFQKHPNIILYLCGDSHEVWPRIVNNYIEITNGCIKYEQFSESTILYGDTEKKDYIFHHWTKAWEPYTAYTEYTKNIQNSIPKEPKDSTLAESHSAQAIITIVTNKRKKIKNIKTLRSNIIKWISNGKSNNVHVKSEITCLNRSHHIYELICKKSHSGLSLNKLEELIFSKYTAQKNLLKFRNEVFEKACELFLKDTTTQEYFDIEDVDDYIYILSNIATNNFKDYDHLLATPGYINIAFIVPLPNGETFSFTSPLSKKALEKADLPTNTLLYAAHGHVKDIYYEIDKTTKMVILFRYYLTLAKKSLSDPQLLNNKHVQDLRNYRLGLG